MRDLPKDRLDINETPFHNTGIDVFGRVLLVKLLKKTRTNQANINRYGVIFTRMSTLAVHLEIATEFSSDSFFLSLCCLIARCGNVEIFDQTTEQTL